MSGRQKKTPTSVVQFKFSFVTPVVIRIQPVDVSSPTISRPSTSIEMKLNRQVATIGDLTTVRRPDRPHKGLAVMSRRGGLGVTPLPWGRVSSVNTAYVTAPPVTSQSRCYGVPSEFRTKIQRAEDSYAGTSLSPLSLQTLTTNRVDRRSRHANADAVTVATARKPRRHGNATEKSGDGGGRRREENCFPPPSPRPTAPTTPSGNDTVTNTVGDERRREGEKRKNKIIGQQTQEIKAKASTTYRVRKRDNTT